MAEKRKRGQNFNLEEKDKLVKLLLEHKNTILNKKTDGATNEAKNNAWIELTNAFNSTGKIYRSKDSLIKVWDKMKTESKLYYSSTRRDTTQTGGGPSEVKTDPILEQVCNILGRGVTGIVNVTDSDWVVPMDAETLHEEGTMPKKAKVIDDINVEIVGEVQIIDSPSTEEPAANIIRTTPLWSRRRPQLSQTNERTEAVSNLCASFNEVNKKKESTEDLKRELLQMEINFKKNLYNLQLQTAAKELEIKNEVLSQLRGGGHSILNNLFGVPQKKAE